MTHIQVGQCFKDNRCGGHGNHPSQEDTVDQSVTQELAHYIAQAHHACHDNQRCHDGRTAHINQFLETELQSQREQQHDNADLCPELDVALHSHRWQQREMRTGQKTGDNIAQHDGLFEHFEYHCGYGAQHKNKRQITYQTVDIECFHYQLSVVGMRRPMKT